MVDYAVMLLNMNKFYFDNESIDRDMSYKKYKLKDLHYIKFDQENH